LFIENCTEMRNSIISGEERKRVHNMEYTEELLDFANQRLDEALKQLAKRQRELPREDVDSGPSCEKRKKVEAPRRLTKGYDFQYVVRYCRM